jgi:predicted RNA-binding Zn-ribbon protein involved in translation (DUF1610 family)
MSVSFSLALNDASAARKVAQDIADRTGQKISVNDEFGKGVFTVSPILPRNEFVVLPEQRGRAQSRGSRMTSATSPAEANVPPACPSCGTRMILGPMEPHSSAHEQRIFKCPSCGHKRTVSVEFN